MRGISQIIFVVVAVVLAAFLLLIGMKAGQKVSEGITGIESVGSTFTEDAKKTDTATACMLWLGGSTYSISGVEVLVSNLRSYSSAYGGGSGNVWDCCGMELEEIMYECKSDPQCANLAEAQGGADSVNTCISACEKIGTIKRYCESNHPSIQHTCMDTILKDIPICTSSVDSQTLSMYMMMV